MKGGEKRKSKVLPIEASVGAQLRNLRLERRMSQADLGAKLGLTFQQVQKYEKGTNRLSLSRAYEICKILKVNIGVLMNDDTPTAGSAVNTETILLAQALMRLHGLSPLIDRRVRTLVDAICDDLEDLSSRL